MKFLYITHTDVFFDLLLKELPGVDIAAIDTSEFVEEADIFENIKDEQFDFLVIPYNLNYRVNRQNDGQGIKLLKYLRMKDILQHCIVYESYKDILTLLKKDAGNFILLDNSTTYLETLTDIGTINLEHLIQKTASKTELKNILALGMDFEQVRHYWANYWGLHRMWTVHKFIEPQFDNEEIYRQHYPAKLRKVLNSYEGVWAQYQYDPSQKGFLWALEEDGKYAQIEMWRNKLKEINPTIVLIDDFADEGWADLTKHIIYGDAENPSFIVLNPTESKSVGQLLLKLKKKIAPPTIVSLIICDLRLFPEDEHQVKISEISGIKLAMGIKANTNIPIMLITGSNKGPIFSFIHNTPQAKLCDSYWVKEGLDSNLSIEKSVNSYFDFVRKIYFAATRIKLREEKIGQNSFESTLERNKAIAKIHEKRKNVVYDTSAFLNDVKAGNTKLFQSVFTQVSFDECVIDTNFFIDPDQFYEAAQSLVILSDIFGEGNLKITIHIKVLAEIIKYGMYPSAQPSNISARNFYLVLKNLQRSRRLKIVGELMLNTVELLTAQRDVIYADDDIIEYCQKAYTDGKSVLLISNDGTRAKSGPRTIMKEWWKNNNTATSYKIMSPGEFVGLINPLIALLNEYSSNN